MPLYLRFRFLATQNVENSHCALVVVMDIFCTGLIGID